MQATTGRTDAGRTYIGQALERLEDAALLCGRGSYADDLGCKPGTKQAAILRSPHAHARILKIDASAALTLAGVRAVLTPEDVLQWARPFLVGVKQPMQHWALAVDRVRYVGEPIAVVVADDRYIAEDALDLIRVEFEPLTAVTEIDSALHDESVLLHETVGSNVVSDRSFEYGAPIAEAGQSKRIHTTVHYPRNSCSPIECGVVIAEYLGEDDGYEALSNFMGPFSLHAVMSMALKVPGNKLRHKVPRDSGGSFGVKQAVFPYVVLMCLAARKAGVPVKWVEDRLEHLSAATAATARRVTIAADVRPDGRILSLHWDQVDEVGAYVRAPEPATLYRMHGCLSGAYDVSHMTVRNRVVVSNKTPTGLVRGFGGPQVYYALERLMDRIAVSLSIDPIALRQLNFVRTEQFPYQAPAGAVLDSGNYLALSNEVMEAVSRSDLYERQQAARAAGRLYGVGVAAVVEPSVSNMGYISTVLTAQQRAKAGPKNGAIASATVSVDLLGGVNVTVASAPAGQGHMTVCAQVVADVLGLQPKQITVNVEFDTAKDAWSVAAGNYSSRFAGAVAGVVHLAACKIRDKLARIAAEQFGCDQSQIVFSDGEISDSGNPAQRLPFARLAANPHWAPALLPDGMEPGLRETVFWTPSILQAPDEADRVNTSAAYGFVFDVCGLEIDPNTGAARVDRYFTGHDAGRLLNPALADGQIHGAYAQGVGAALLEEFRYGEDGSFQSGTLADYLMPTACELVDPVVIHMQTPSPFTPLGAKGLGEGNNMSTPVCIANAFADALRPNMDLEDVRLPLSPGRVMALLKPEDPGSKERPAPKVAEPNGKGLSLEARGDVDIAAPPEKVFEVLLDPVALAKVIPGCHALRSSGTNRYFADVTIGVGLVKARYEAEIVLSEIDAPRSLRLAGSGRSALGIGAGDGTVVLVATPAGTRLSYDYRAQVGGKVAMVGSRMLEGAARIIVSKLFESLGHQASGGIRAKSWWQKLLQRLGGKA